MQIKISVVESNFQIEACGKLFSVGVGKCPSIGAALKKAFKEWDIGQPTKGDSVFMSEGKNCSIYICDVDEDNYVDVNGPCIVADQNDFMFMAIEQKIVEMEGEGSFTIDFTMDEVKEAWSDAFENGLYQD